MNSFSKSKVIRACKIVLLDIESDREAWKAKMCSGHRQFGFFGRKLTPNEAYEKLSSWAKSLIQSTNGKQETVVKRILSVAECCEGDTINLSNDEFAMISSYWE